MCFPGAPCSAQENLINSNSASKLAGSVLVVG
jgi:hypothetical protein